MTENPTAWELVSDVAATTASGHSEPLAIAAPEYLLTLSVREAVEQQALEVTVQGSVDGATWGKPFAALPQVFYSGEWSLRFRPAPEHRYARVQWRLQRWGRGTLDAWCRFRLELRGSSDER
ncbi:MAG: hypothetical protein ACYC6M_03940 [Terriglobales bacterium]